MDINKIGNIGESIRNIRKTRGITQKALGEKIGVSPATITKYERGDLKLDVATSIEIATALNVSLNDIVFGYEKCEHSFTNFIEELGYRFEDEGIPVTDNEEGNVIDYEIETFLFHNKKCYHVSNDSFEKLKNDVIAYAEFKLQQLIKEGE